METQIAERVVAEDEPPGALPTEPDQRRSSSARIVGIGFAILAVVALAALLVVSGSDGQPADLGIAFMIPAGSKTRVIPEFESAVIIPTAIRFGPGEVAAITIINEDDVTHRAGPFLVGSGQTYTQRFPEPGSYPIAYSVDPAESIVVTVEG